ncbi:hypothetical protein KKF84_01430, partial [Myxococcota bacterium]|nr:hypothetical protein [Myxococcota bacterium]
MSRTYGYKGETNIPVTVEGANTQFTQGETTVTSNCNGMNFSGVSVSSLTSMSFTYTIDSESYPQNCTFFFTTYGEHLFSSFEIRPDPSFVSIAPDEGKQGTAFDISITGQNTHFSQTESVLSFSGTPEILVDIKPETTAELFQATITIPEFATRGVHSFTLTTGAEIIEGTFTVLRGDPWFSISQSSFTMLQSYPVTVETHYMDLTEAFTVTNTCGATINSEQVTSSSSGTFTVNVPLTAVKGACTISVADAE